MQKIKVYIPILLSIAAVAGIWIGTKMNYSERPLAYHMQDVKEQKLRQIINFIDYEYVDDVNTDSLLDVTIEELLHKLDPHSSYISKKDVQRTAESLQGSFEGIGVEFTSVRDSLTVLRVIEHGPSFKSGVKAGDRITIVNNDTIAGIPMSNSEYIGLLKGPAGTEVDIVVYRPIEHAEHPIKITRGTIPIPSVDVSFLLNDNVGLIKINRFAETTDEEFDNALNELKKQGARNIILDLRDNPGGLLYTANKVADQFLEKNTLIVYTKNRQGEREDSKATTQGQFEEGQVIVLINENSASASEIVAGALQDNDRATIVGRRSYGKGLVQEEIELKDGSKIRLTTSRYYTPTGRSIQRPYDSSYSAYRHEAIERYHNGELFNADSIKVDSVQQFTTPGGKLVYGGGGIVPDVFVPIDTHAIQMYSTMSFGQLDNFAFQYIDKNRKDFESYTYDSFALNYVLDSEVIDELYTYLHLSKSAEKELIKDEKALSNRLKALMGRNLFGAKAYYRINAPQDAMIIRSLELIDQ
ncbi:MAG: S41 family peptidase [Schleiferiaceae bacterium]|jgi:carboxyl-terminal processing protease|nr:S41 family peptidase [Schleiferiaceae bacterium]